MCYPVYKHDGKKNMLNEQLKGKGNFISRRRRGRRRKNLTGLYVGQAKNYMWLQVARRISCGSRYHALTVV